MNGETSAVDQSAAQTIRREASAILSYDSRPSGSPARVVKADPTLVSDVPIISNAFADEDLSDRKYEDTMAIWDATVADVPSDDEEGEVFDRNVASLLIGMNMVRYLHIFKENDVGLKLFLTLTEEDLNSLGVEDQNHSRTIAHAIANIRKKKKDVHARKGLKDDVADSSLTVQEAIPLLCHTLKHINNMVILLRNYRNRINSKGMRNQVMDQHYSAALGAKILAKEALVQAELLKVQLHGMLLHIDPIRSDKSLTRKAKPSTLKKSKRDKQAIFGAVVISASISVLLFLLGRR